MESSGKQIIRFILTGPESTGKSVLSKALAKHYNKEYIAEYARDYVLNLKRPYTYDDILKIAEKQVELMNSFSSRASGFLFVDTYLIITKIWFVKVFGKYPEWIDKVIRNTKNDFYLLCKPDIPWVADGIRENGGKKREQLFNDYQDELHNAGLQYALIGGEWDVRLNNTIQVIDQIIAEKGLK